MIVGGFRPFKTKNPKIVANELIDQLRIQMERDAFAARDQSDHSIADSAQVFHRSAQTWLEKKILNGLGTCPITENGVIRIMSQNAYPNCQIQRLQRLQKHVNIRLMSFDRKQSVYLQMV